MKTTSLANTSSPDAAAARTTPRGGAPGEGRAGVDGRPSPEEVATPAGTRRDSSIAVRPMPTLTTAPARRLVDSPRAGMTAYAPSSAPTAPPAVFAAYSVATRRGPPTPAPAPATRATSGSVAPIATVGSSTTAAASPVRTSSSVASEVVPAAIDA
jgi:hypothetical protein